ncbi:triose-phosphate isomerase [Candidatus Azambacteria bacterium]|nr:triose-phosphate isomerase [Candidatus Azambacteria bacterium]
MKYLIANWKAYITSHKDAKALFKATQASAEASMSEVIICPPFPFIPDVKQNWDMALGVQDVFWEEKGAYTGEVTLEMLKNLNVEYVILGHSERRNYLGETDEVVNKKVKAALKAGFKVILCVGEKERKEENVIPTIVAEQIRADLDGVPKTKIPNILVAYEPIWAIGTGLSDTPENAHQAALYIRKTIGDMYHTKLGVGIKVLYGGSVNSKNVLDFVNYHGIDGVLVGSASAKKDEFTKMIKMVG